MCHGIRKAKARGREKLQPEGKRVGGVGGEELVLVGVRAEGQRQDRHESISDSARERHVLVPVNIRCRPPCHNPCLRTGNRGYDKATCT